MLLRIWNGKQIRHREDGFLSLTDMAHSCGKKYADWARLDSTKSYLETLSSVMRFPITELLEVNQGGIPHLQGTWGHRKVAIRFAQWCSDEFAVQVDSWVEELLTNGKIDLVTPKQVELPPSDIRLSNLVDSLKFLKDNLGLQLDNPRFKQELQDSALNILGVGQDKSLTSTKEIWLGVAERAEQLGYPVALVCKNRSPLGKYVASFNLKMVKENRFCNGTERAINLYLLTPDLDMRVKEFMDAKLSNK